MRAKSPSVFHLTAEHAENREVVPELWPWFGVSVLSLQYLASAVGVAIGAWRRHFLSMFLGFLPFDVFCPPIAVAPRHSWLLTSAVRRSRNPYLHSAQHLAQKRHKSNDSVDGLSVHHV
ncbi:MAG: hypothetical protein L6R28_11015 [Planctomycetes bacterium]|nr:hypothetical protein [Planctomycetota bacterium]